MNPTMRCVEYNQASWWGRWGKKREHRCKILEVENWYKTKYDGSIDKNKFTYCIVDLQCEDCEDHYPRWQTKLSPSSLEKMEYFMAEW